MEGTYGGKFTLDELNIVLNEFAKKKEEDDKMFHKWYLNQCESNPKFKAIVEAKMKQDFKQWLTLPKDEPIEFTDAQIEMWLRISLRDKI